MKKPLVVYVLSERMPGEDWLIVAVYATETLADDMARTLATANESGHQTRIDVCSVVSA